MLKRLGPWAVTLAIFALLALRIPLQQVGATLAGARWGHYLLLVVPHGVFLAIYSFIGAVWSGELGRAIPVWVYLLLLGYAAFHLWFFSRPRSGRLGTATVFGAFRRAHAWQYLALLVLKTPNLLAAVTVHWLALPLFGMHVPFTMLLTYLPLVFFAAALPIAAAHLGPSQAAWVYFFQGSAPPAGLIAYSLAAHVSFMVTNALVGLVFLRRAQRELT